jgi:hypothetical protein
MSAIAGFSISAILAVLAILAISSDVGDSSPLSFQAQPEFRNAEQRQERNPEDVCRVNGFGTKGWEIITQRSSRVSFSSRQ